MPSIRVMQAATTFFDGMLGTMRAKPTFFRLLLLLAIVYLLVFLQLFAHEWSQPESGHGPIVLALAIWLLYRKWDEARSLTPIGRGQAIAAIALFVVAAMMYIVGVVGEITQLAYGSIVPFLCSGILIYQNRGFRANLLLPIFFLLFSIPLPGFIVDPITLPMKQLVAASSEMTMHVLGYPVARSGVLLFVGPYELQVADACAGLRTLFTLEALGLLYMSLVESASRLRNVGLALLVIPISLISNILRVTALCVITYHWGDEAGQGFLHEFAGLALFSCALLMLIFADAGLRSVTNHG